MPIPAAFQTALDELQNVVLTGREKGLPDVHIRLGDVARQGWNVLRGDVPLPAMVIRWADLRHNVSLMQAYADAHGAWLAPHGKTTMAPQIFAQQLEAGAWAITLANIAQLQVARSFGMERIMLANEAVSDYDCRYLARALRADGFEPYVQADSLQAVARLAAAVASERPGRPLNVLVELGMPGGRCGARTLGEARTVAQAVCEAHGLLRLAGVEGYEGIVHGATRAESAAMAGAFLARLAEAARALRPIGDVTFLAVAGGSLFFDLVMEHLGREALPEAQLVLRPGAYVAHDSVHYADDSPFGRVLGPADPAGRLRAVLEVWATVLSRPEPDVAILSFGKRDAPEDLDLPVPLYHSRSGAPALGLGNRFEVFRMQDQHTYVRLPAGADWRVGDCVGLGISHPCTSFDKWRVMLTVDDERNVIGAVRTFF